MYRYGMGYGMFFDPTYILVILAAVIAMAASAYCRSVMSRYSRMRVSTGTTGQEAAERVLHAAGIYDVGIRQMGGRGISFYRYDKTVNLSDELFHQPSITAVATAAHECGHAMQHASGYVVNRAINLVNPVMQLSSNAAIPIFILGLILSFRPLQTLGIVLFCVVVAFQLLTLPSEFNASRRAVVMLQSTGIIQTEEEVRGVKKVLIAAALTYVAALASALLQLLRLIILAGGRNRD
ncbi:MAG: zinc metallopeptidase [Clostridia bacterium]|nr:zinc metallopeptidase [Clostridia bacterium]NCC42244.1 zinc metallopeptidase [Clostridia bacterium]